MTAAGRGCNLSPDPARQRKSRDNERRAVAMKVFDTHIHYPSEDFLGRPYMEKTGNHLYEIDRIAEQCSKNNIVKACLLGGAGEVNDWVLQAHRNYSELFIPMAYIDMDSENPEKVNDYCDMGFRGFKIIATRKNYDHPDYFAFYEKMQSRRAVVLFHTGVLGGITDYLINDPQKVSEKELAFEKVLASFGTSSARMRSIYLDTIAMKFPELRIIGAHLGYGEYDLSCAVARWRRNVYFDISGGDVVRRHLTERRYVGKEISPKKLVFGSDCVTERIGSEVSLWLEQLEALGLTQEEINRIMYENAAYLFS